MNREDIIRMAREARTELVTQDYPGHIGQLDPWTMRLLERFAALVAAAEREQCAKWCLEMVEKGLGTHAWAAAGFIRQGGKDARGQA